MSSGEIAGQYIDAINAMRDMPASFESDNGMSGAMWAFVENMINLGLITCNKCNAVCVMFADQKERAEIREYMWCEGCYQCKCYDCNDIDSVCRGCAGESYCSECCGKETNTFAKIVYSGTKCIYVNGVQFYRKLYEIQTDYKLCEHWLREGDCACTCGIQISREEGLISRCGPCTEGLMTTLKGLFGDSITMLIMRYDTIYSVDVVSLNKMYKKARDKEYDVEKALSRVKQEMTQEVEALYADIHKRYCEIYEEQPVDLSEL